MKYRSVPVIIMLVAGLAACLVCIIYNRSVLDTLVITLVVLAIFYIIGLIAQTIFQKYLIIEIEKSKEEIDDIESEVDNEELQNVNIEKNEDQSIKK